MACHHTWAEEVKLSAVTANLSGEATVWCPKCGDRGVISFPVYDAKQCDCCGQYRPDVERCWYGAIETFACQKCRGDEDAYEKYKADAQEAFDREFGS